MSARIEKVVRELVRSHAHHLQRIACCSSRVRDVKLRRPSRGVGKRFGVDRPQADVGGRVTGREQVSPRTRESLYTYRVRETTTVMASLSVPARC
jgi:hypothetical protein